MWMDFGPWRNPEPWGNHFSSPCAERGGGGEIVGGEGVGWVEDVPVIGISQIPVRLGAAFFGDVGWGWEGTGSRRCSRRWWGNEGGMPHGSDDAPCGFPDGEDEGEE
jgi:hypothetical protein